jgi:hypothetical protein
VLQTIVVVLFASMALPSPQAMADGVTIDSREYKLSLNSEKFAGQSPKDMADRLWERALKPAIVKRLGAHENGEPRYQKAFKLTETRAVRFWDTRSAFSGATILPCASASISSKGVRTPPSARWL